MSQVVTARLRQDLADQLLREHARLRRSLERLAAAERALSECQRAESGATGEQGDIASDLAELSLDAILERAEYERLAEVRAALQRITTGTYGVCESCGGAIDVNRLCAHPWAALCIGCAARGARAALARRR